MFPNSNIFTLLYPTSCVSCERALRKPEEFLCLHCKEDLYKEYSLIQNNNEIAQLFWGKCKVEYAGAVYNFVKGGSIQKVVHSFKYQGKKKLAIHMGEVLGEEMANANDFIIPDLVTGVPSSFKKRIKRGYNQSDLLAKGLSNTLNITYSNKLLIKHKSNTTQTDKNVSDRYQNMENTILPNVKVLKKQNPKHILIIDDVITTGATLVACVNAIHEALTDCKVSVVALAYRNI